MLLACCWAVLACAADRVLRLPAGMRMVLLAVAAAALLGAVVRPLALDLFKRAECHYLILKLGERGLIAYRSPGPQPREFFTIDNFVEHLEDPIGAGDALLAYSSMAVARTNNIVIASILGAIGAAVVCERQGNTPVTPHEVDEKIATLERRAAFAHG